MSNYQISNPRKNNGIVTWDCIWSGRYFKNNSTNKEDVKWRVLKIDGDDVFLIADNAIDCKQYNPSNETMTWENCFIRDWLNDEFYNEIFNSVEQSAIKSTSVVNNGNPEKGTEGSATTSDKVYLLSIDEARESSYGFNTNYNEHDKARKCKPTQYAIDMGARVSLYDEYPGNCYWWLRSPGYHSLTASFVSYNQSIDCDGDWLALDYIGVRPVLHLDLSVVSAWRYAGTVDTEDNVVPVSNKYIIVFNANGGTVATDSKVIISGNQYGELPTPTRDGYDFLGWFTESELGSEITAEMIFNNNANQILYAHWELSPKGNRDTKSYFPSRIDSFSYYSDLRLDDVDIYKHFQQLLNQEKYVEASEYIQNANCDYIGAYVFNRLQNRVISVENYVLRNADRNKKVVFNKEEPASPYEGMAWIQD